jgi:hypothetical protein
MPANPCRAAPRTHRDESTYGFAVLEIARENGDFEQAAQASRQLRRLGVQVTYRRPTVASAEGRRDG